MRCATILAFAFVVTFATLAQGEDRTDGNVSAPALAQFGIGGLQPMSDSQGQEVRGEGFVYVGSYSFALGRVDRDSAFSSGAPRVVSTRARRSVSFGGFSVRAGSSGFAFAAAR